jgi:iron complex outermembrane receptor protein
MYDALGKVEADFYAGFNTNVSVQLPNAGSIDLFAQIDGRAGGNMVSNRIREAYALGNIELSMFGRDAENGGEKRINYKGEEVYNGLVLDGVFDKEQKVVSLLNGTEVDLAGMTMREAVDAGHIQPMMAAQYYSNSGNFSAHAGLQELIVSDATYFALREVTIGYNFPEKWIKHVGLQSARLSFSGRNLGYIYNGFKAGVNPESISTNNPLTPMDYGGVPFARNFSVNLNLRF